MFSFFKKKNQDEILEARKDQRKFDEEEFRREKERISEKHNQEMKLQEQIHLGKLKMLEGRILTWENREKELQHREYICKSQINVNYAVATEITHRMENAALTFMNELKGMKSVFDETGGHYDKIKEIGK